MSGGKSGSSSNTTKNAAVIETDNIRIIESKKRRTGNGLDSSQMGLTEDILMDSDDVLLSEKTNNTMVPKNAYVAGTHVGTRLSL